MADEKSQMRNGKFRSRLETLPPDSERQVIDEIGRLVNEESHGLEFALTVKATLVVGKKALSQ